MIPFSHGIGCLTYQGSTMASPRPHSPDPLDVPLHEQPRQNPSFWITSPLGVLEIQNPSACKQGYCPQHSEEQHNPYHHTLVKYGYLYSHTTAVVPYPVYTGQPAQYVAQHTYKFVGMVADHVGTLDFTDWVISVQSMGAGIYKLESHRLGTSQPHHKITPSLLEQFLKRKINRFEIEARKGIESGGRIGPHYVGQVD